tara:strand:+ start:186 stop:464 length:279 start_codon:yes stop_codon:yes gene_type:complete
MKKFLIALTMVMGATNAHAFDIKFNTAGTNGDMLGQILVQQIVKQIVPTGVIQNGNVRINTGSVHNPLVQKQCYTKFVYDAQGNAKPFVSCY